LVKGFEIIKTYPLIGNEKTIGYHLTADSLHKRAAKDAIKKNKIFFEGPFQLVQGGMGIVGREPIYKNGKFWGFSAVIIKTKTFLKSIHLDDFGSTSNFEYQIVQKEGDLSGPKFFKNNGDFSNGDHSSIRFHGASLEQDDIICA
jgi:sensor domain CHASE-containing protein